MDIHLSRVSVALEADLATLLGRPIAYGVFDGEGSGLPIAQRYAKAEQNYISVLPRQADQSRAAFRAQGTWQPVAGHPDHEAVDAIWTDVQKAAKDPRRLVLMRPFGRVDPTRVYASRIPSHICAVHPRGTMAMIPGMRLVRYRSNLMLAYPSGG